MTTNYIVSFPVIKQVRVPTYIVDVVHALTTTNEHKKFADNIAAIKLVRSWALDNNVSELENLKSAKDFVDGLRDRTITLEQENLYERK